MELTTERIIKSLPLDKNLKDQLLSGWDKLSSGEQFEMRSLLWDAYYAFYQIRLQKNIELEMAKAREGKALLDDTFYKRVQAQTEKEMETEEEKNVTSTELDLVRNKISALLNERSGS